jgi:hypothetical protein
VREGSALADYPALYQGMVTRRRARVEVGLFYGSRATIDVAHLED